MTNTNTNLGGFQVRGELAGHTVLVSTQLKKPRAEIIDRLAAQNNISRTEVVRQMLDYCIDQVGGGNQTQAA